MEARAHVCSSIIQSKTALGRVGSQAILCRVLSGDISGFILAGGKSRRMGVDKSSLHWGDGTLLTCAIQKMRSVAEKTYVVGGCDGHKRGLGFELLHDSFPDRGPMGGLHTALSRTTTEWNLILAVDLPLVTTALLRFIAEMRSEEKIAVVPSSQGLQTLCAAYHRSLLPEIENALTNDRLSMHRLLQSLQELADDDGSACHSGLRMIEEQELIAHGFGLETLMNVNTPADLERARAFAQLHG